MKQVIFLLFAVFFYSTMAVAGDTTEIGNAAPEPGTFALLGIGALMLVISLIKKR